MVEKICPVCQLTFFRYPSDAKKVVHCSRKCSKRSKKISQTPEPSEKIVARFWSKITKSVGCWLFNGNRLRYGNFYRREIDGGRIRAHVFSFLLHGGELPAGQVVRHKCDTPGCVRPDHLEPGTMSSNTRDMLVRERNKNSCRFTGSQVIEIRRRFEAGESHSDLAKAYSVSLSYLNQLLHHNWRHLPMPIRRFNQNRKLTAEQVKTIRIRHKMGEEIRKLAAEFDVSATNIRHIIQGKTWKQVS